LTGIPYGKDKAKYTLEITGNPEEDVTMKCTINAVSIKGSASQEFNLKLVKI